MKLFQSREDKYTQLLTDFVAAPNLETEISLVKKHQELQHLEAVAALDNLAALAYSQGNIELSNLFTVSRNRLALIQSERK